MANGGLDQARTSFFILCDSHTMNGGKHNYYGVFNRMYAKSFPCVHQKMHVAIEVQGPPDEERTLNITFKDSGGEAVIPPANVPVKFSTFGGTTIGLELQGLPLPKPGIYSFQICDGDHVIGQRDLFVEQTPETRS